MSSSLLEFVPEALELATFGIGSVLLSVAGAYLERLALVTFESGQVTVAGWAAVVGTVAFYAAFLMVTDKFRPKLASLR